MPLRPIFTGYRSLTAPVEEYLKDIFEPLLENCDYLLKSTKDFKKSVLANRINFNPRTDELIT